MIAIRTFLTCGFVLSTAMVASLTANAQSYPAKPVRLIVPYAPGGSVDSVARIVGQKLQENIGQPVVIDNRPGASGTIGVEATAKALPDGYTFVVCAVGALTINAYLNKLPYDPLKDLAAVSRLVTSALVISANPSFPVKSISELIAYAKARPGTVSFSVTGPSSQTFLAGELLKSMAGINMVSVPYKGGAPAATAVASGEVQFGITDTGAALPFIRSSKARAIAVTYPKRSPTLPEIPTVAESGLPGFEIVTWIGMFAPTGTPAEIISKMNAEIGKVLQASDVRERILKTEQDVAPSSAEELARMLRSDSDLYAKLLRDAGVKPEQ